MRVLLLLCLSLAVAQQNYGAAPAPRRGQDGAARSARGYYNVRHVNGPNRGQFMRGRNAAEKAEFEHSGFIRRGELRSTAGRAGAEQRRSAVQAEWNARKEKRANGYVASGALRSRADDADAYAKRRARIMELLEARRKARTTTATTTRAPATTQKPAIDTRVVESPSDQVRYLGGWATREFRDQREAELKRERDAERMERFRAEIAYRSNNRPY